jgi:hypothetical protein
MAKLLPFNDSIQIPPGHNERWERRRRAAAARCGVTLEVMENYINALSAIHRRRDEDRYRREEPTRRHSHLRLVRRKRAR